MAARFVALVVIQLIDDGAHALGVVLVRHQHRIRSLDHDGVLEAMSRHQSMTRDQQAALGIQRQHVALNQIAVVAFTLLLQKRGPGANVGPAGIEGHHRGGNRLSLASIIGGTQIRFRQPLHHRVVDGIAGAALVGLPAETEKLIVLAPVLHCLKASFENPGPAAIDGLKPDRGAQNEHTAVPQVLPRSDVGLRRLQLGLFHEGGDAVTAGIFSDPHVGAGIAADVAVTGIRPRRHDAQGDDKARAGNVDGGFQRGAKGLSIGNGVVGRQHHHYRVAAAAHQKVGGRAQRGRRVPALRLEQDAGRRAIDLVQLVADEKALLFVAYHQQWRGLILSGQPIEPEDGVLKQRVFSGELQELLWKLTARKRPESGSRSAGEHNRPNVGNGSSGCAQLRVSGKGTGYILD